jgi:transposase
MPRSRPPYPSEYWAELVCLVREDGRAPTDLAREFEPSAQSITNWVAQAEIDAGKRQGLSSDEKAELKRPRSENRVLRMENGSTSLSQHGNRSWGAPKGLNVNHRQLHQRLRQRKTETPSEPSQDIPVGHEPL